MNKRNKKNFSTWNLSPSFHLITNCRQHAYYLRIVGRVQSCKLYQNLTNCNKWWLGSKREEAALMSSESWLQSFSETVIQAPDDGSSDELPKRNTHFLKEGEKIAQGAPAIELPIANYMTVAGFKRCAIVFHSPFWFFQSWTKKIRREKRTNWANPGSKMKRR